MTIQELKYHLKFIIKNFLCYYEYEYNEDTHLFSLNSVYENEPYYENFLQKKKLLNGKGKWEECEYSYFRTYFYITDEELKDLEINEDQLKSLKGIEKFDL